MAKKHEKKAKRTDVKQFLSDIKGGHNLKTFSQQLGPNRFKTTKGRLELQQMITPRAGEPYIKAESASQQILQDLVRFQNKSEKNLNRKLEHATRNALMQTFKHLGVADVQDIMINEGLTDVGAGHFVQKLVDMSRKYERPSLLKNIRKQVGMIGDIDFDNMTTKYSFSAESVNEITGGKYRKYGSDVHATLEELIGKKFGKKFEVAKGFKVIERAGAPLVEIGIRKGKDKFSRIHIPLTSRVPISDLNYNVFGMLDTVDNQKAGRSAVTFGEHIINKLVADNGLLDQWDANKFHFRLKGNENLKVMRKMYGDLFPHAAPASPESGMQQVWEQRFKTAVNIQLPEDIDPKEVPGFLEDQAKRKGLYFGPKGDIIRAKGKQFVQMQRGQDLSKLVPFGGTMFWGRKPLSFMRPELYMTKESVSMARQFERERGIKPLTTSAAAKHMPKARNLTLPMMYVPKSYTLPVREGEMAITEEVVEMLATQKERRFHILERPHAVPIAKQIEEARRTGKPVRLPPGATLGMGYESRLLKQASGVVTYGGASTDLDAIISATLGDDITDVVKSVRKAKDSEYLEVVVERTLRGHSAVKLFGDVKDVARPQSRAALADLIARGTQAGVRPEGFMDIGLLLKDPRLRRKQMTTGLRQVLGQMGKTGDFVEDPLRYLADVEGQQYGVERRLLSLTRKHGVTGAALGAVFGTYADEMSEGAAAIKEIGFTAAEQKMIRKHPFAYGEATVTPGGSLDAPEIVRGGFEPRAMWKAGFGGQVGESVAGLVGERRQLQAAGAVGELRKAMLAVEGADELSRVLTGQQMAAAKPVTSGLLMQGGMASIWSQEGMLLKFTEEQRKAYGLAPTMYLPSITEVQSMGTYAGERGSRKALTTLARYERALTAIYTKEPAKNVAAAMGELKVELSEQYARAVAGKDKLAGTVYARVQSQAEGLIGPLPSSEAGRYIEREVEVRASRDLMEKMWADSTDHRFVKSQRAAFLRGDAVEGLAWRHPQTGRIGALPVRFKYDSMLDDLGHQLEASESVMKVLMGDYDGDNITITTVMNKRERETVRKILKNNVVADTLESSMADDALFRGAKRAGGALAAPYSEAAEKVKQLVGSEIGALDISFEKLYKGAVATGDPRVIAGAAKLYQYVPQEIISAKHLSPEAAAAMVGTSREVSAAVEGVMGGSTLARANAIREVIGQRFDIEKLAKGGLNVADVITESLMGLEKPSVKAQEIEAFMRMGTKGAGEALILASDPMKVLKTAEEAAGSMYRHGMPDPVLALKKGSTGFSGVETLTANMKTMAKNQFAGMGKGTAMVAAATAMAGALFYLGAKSREETPFGGYNIMAPPPRPAPTPASQMEIPDLNFQAKPKYIQPESIQGGQLKTGQIESPQGIQQTPRAMVDRNTTPMSNVIRIRGKESANVDYNEISKKIIERMKMPSNVSVNINDNSRAITSEMIDRLIEGS